MTGSPVSLQPVGHEVMEMGRHVPGARSSTLQPAGHEVMEMDHPDDFLLTIQDR